MKKSLLILGIVVAGVTFVVYAPTLSFGFVPGADDGVKQQSTNDVALHFAGAYGGTWNPMRSFSHALDIAIWGLEAPGHHLTNVLLHSVNAALLFWLSLNVIVAYKERILGFVHLLPEDAMRANVIAGLLSPRCCFPFTLFVLKMSHGLTAGSSL